MTDKMKIAASILDENTELVAVAKKESINTLKSFDKFRFLQTEGQIDDIDQLNNVFFSILDKYQVNAFDLFNLKEISKTLSLDIDIKTNSYDIDLLLYRVATNLNTPLLINKESAKIDNQLKINLQDLEVKFDFLMEDIDKISKKLKRIESIKKKIKKENNIIHEYVAKSNNLSLEKLKLEKIEDKIVKIKKSIIKKVIIIKDYINEKLNHGG